MLIVIDCQCKYPAVNLIAGAVVKEVLRARSRNEWVMLVTFGGRTVKRITRHLRGYQKVVKVSKGYDDGSPAIFERLFAYHWRTNNNLNVKHVGRVRHLRVVGVNTSACVMKTVDGLRRFVRVTVVKNACANSADMRGMSLPPEVHHRGALRRMSKWANVRVI